MSTPAFPSRPGCTIPFTPKVEIVPLVPDCDIPDPPSGQPGGGGTPAVPVPSPKVGDGYRIAIRVVDAATTGSITLEDTQTVDDIPLSDGDLCLVKNNGASENGVYRVKAAVGGDPGTWERLETPSAVLVAGGTENGQLWFYTNNLGGNWDPPGAVYL